MYDIDMRYFGAGSKGSSSGYWTTAEQLDLFGGLYFLQTESISRQEMAALVCQVLELPILQPSADDPSTYVLMDGVQGYPLTTLKTKNFE